ncbi:MAG: hypothetical protein DBX59_11380 [Bacillota bacterium]|nr:MAG: hypothetical protein DBX59_11380 [Bacillota bacterium]
MLNFLLEGEGAGNNVGTWVIYGVLAALIIGFFVWTTISSKKRRKQEEEKLASLKIGDKVKTIGGVCGVVIAIDDAENTFTLETGSGSNVSYIKFDKGAIYQTAPSAEAQAAEAKSEEKSEPAAEPFEEATPAEAAEPAEEKKENE